MVCLKIFPSFPEILQPLFPGLAASCKINEHFCFIGHTLEPQRLSHTLHTDVRIVDKERQYKTRNPSVFMADITAVEWSIINYHHCLYLSLIVCRWSSRSSTTIFPRLRPRLRFLHFLATGGAHFIGWLRSLFPATTTQALFLPRLIPIGHRHSDSCSMGR